MRTRLLFDAAAESAESGDFLAKVEAFLGNSIVSALLRFVAAAALLFIGFKLIGWLSKKLEKTKGFSKMSPELRSFLHNTVRVILYALLILSAVALLGVPMASIVAVVSSIGLAIGLALQGSLSNLAGGLMLMAFRPFRIGDFITTEELSGKVTDLGLFYTTIETVDNRRIMLPNANLSNNAIVNTTAMDTRRLELSFPLMQETDFEQVKAILLPFGDQPETLRDVAEPEVVITNLTPLALTVTLRFWCRTADYWPLYYRINPQAVKALNEANVPFAHAEPDYEIE